MQDESGETDVDNGTLAWLCPLCQEKQMNREQLTLHLTHRHSVLPACLDRLLDTDALIQGASEGTPEKDAAIPHTHMEISTTQPAPSEGTSTLSRESGFKVVSQPEKNDRGEERDQESTEFNSSSDDEKSKFPKSYENLDDVLGTTEKNNLTTADLALEKNVNPRRSFKCNVCLESFTSRNELSVHCSSATHLQRMQIISEQGGDKDSFSSSVSSPHPDLSQPYISSKPYKCAVCRVSYNHAITLESHLKSVLHQTRSRNAGNSASSIADKSGRRSSKSSGTNTTAINCTASSRSNVAPSLSVTDNSCSTQGGLSTVTMKTKDGEQIQSQAALSLLSSPVASAQAVSTFLTLLPSTSHSSLMPSLITANTGASPITTAPQLISPQQLLLPLFLNGLQTQNQTPVLETSSHILTQSVPVLDINAVRQSLITQRLGLQNPELPVDVSSLFSISEKDKTVTTGSGVDKVIMEENSRVNSEAHDNICLKHTVSAEEGINNEQDQRKCTEDNSTINSGNNSEIKDGLNNKIGETIDETGHVNKSNGNDNGELIKECGKVSKKTDVVQPNLPTEAECGYLDFRMSQPKNLVSLTLGSDTSSQKSHIDSCLNILPTENSKLTSHVISSKMKSPSKLTTADNTNLTKTSQDPNANVETSGTKSCPLMLSEFQSQVLWAFLESRSEVDMASSPLEDCEALAREVGLSEREVCKWLQEAREVKEQQKEDKALTSGFKVVPRETEVEGICESMNVLPEKKKVDLQTQGGETTNQENCLTSESDSEDFYTAVIVTDEESQNSPVRDEQSSSGKKELAEERSAVGGKGFWSTTVFLSDPEDEYDDSEESKDLRMKKKRKTLIETEELNTKREKLDPDIDLELEAQTDSPPPPTFSQQQDVPRISTIGSPHLSLSLTPFATHFFSPSILSLPPSVSLEIAEGVGDTHKGNSTIFSKLPDTHLFPDLLRVPTSGSCTILPKFLSCQGNYESALDLSVGKNYTLPSASLTSSLMNKSMVQSGHIEGCGLKPTNTGGLIVVHVKPGATHGVPASNYGGVGSGINNNNNNSLYRKAAERLNTSVKELKIEKVEDEAKRHKSTKPRRLRDMRRSRTIIQAEQLDVLYGCYFKDPNPGKQEFEQISEWVHLPKRVVQIWFQNMRARERKGEVRFLGDGTLAAVGKPLIKFTWPLKKPILSNINKSNASSLGSSRPSRLTAEGEVTKSLVPCRKTTLKTEAVKEKEASAYRNGATSSFSKSSSLISKVEPQAPAPKIKVSHKVSPSCLQAIKMEACSSYPSQRCKRDRSFVEVAGNHAEEEDESVMRPSRPGSINRMVPKLSFAHLCKLPGSESQKHNGLNMSPKKPFKISTLSRDQLGLTTSSPTTSTSTVTSTTPTVTSSPKMKNPDCSPHSTPRRPRTLLTNLQLAILQSCYETCSHPHALECEAVGSELGLPLKVVQIWFQNTRAKEKRWRLQQEKESPSLANSNSVDLSSASYLQYSALRANRPILPKPVQLTVLEPSTSPAAGQPAGQEILRGKCLVCDAGFDSRAAARVHVFSPCHLAMLKATNFGQSSSPVSQGSSTVSSSPLSSPSSKKVVS